MDNDWKIINPWGIKQSELPMPILIDNRRSWFSFKVKAHTGGNYNHIAIMHKYGVIASQDPKGYREIPIKNYMRPEFIMKFWHIKELTPIQRTQVIDEVIKDLRVGKWNWKNRYDWLGVIGQLIHVRWINDPWRKYCSERVRKYLINDPVKIWIPPHPTPSDINTVFNKSTKMEVRGYWIGD